MSKLFDDPEYKRMSTDEESWLELAIEPFRFHLNDLIPLLPDRIELDFEDILHLLKGHTDDKWMDLNTNGLLGPIIKKVNKNLSDQEISILMKMYTISIDEDAEINFVDKYMSHPIVISKIAYEIPEDEIKEIVAKLAVNSMNIVAPTSSKSGHSETVSRMNEILDLITPENKADRSTRSTKRKRRAIEHRIRKIIIEDEWRIRDYTIIKNFCNNVETYINNGNMHCLMNVTRLKCMTHKGAPIYSMGEIE